MPKRSNYLRQSVVGKKWSFPEVLAVVVFVLLLIAGLLGFVGVFFGWWDMPNPSVDPIHRTPMGGGRH